VGGNQLENQHNSREAGDGTVCVLFWKKADTLKSMICGYGIKHRARKKRGGVKEREKENLNDGTQRSGNKCG